MSTGELDHELEQLLHGFDDGSEGPWDQTVPKVASAPRQSVDDIMAAAGLDAVTESTTPAEIERCMRALGPLVSGIDAIARHTLRLALMRRLDSAKIRGVAPLVDAALGAEVVAGDAATVQGRPLALADPEPWGHAVDGADLLSAIRDTLRRYIVLPEHAAVALALWTLHTHAIEVAYVSPILALTSPQKRCGKTTVLELLGCMVRRPLSASNVTAAALFRAVEAFGPTLLVDEAETFLPNHEELRGVLDSGHTRTSAQVVRTVGDDHQPRVFRTFGAKAIAAIGALPSTIEDRAVIVRMQRRARGENVERIRRDRIEAELLPLRRQAARWAADHIEALRGADPLTPSSLHDRAADNWRPLFAIADVAGGNWPEMSRAAAIGLSPTGDDDAESGVMLLADLRDLFHALGVEQLASAAIVEHLTTLESRPWPEWRRGKPIAVRGLARLLAPFGVYSKTVRTGVDTAKGYGRADLVEAWTRYLPAEPGSVSVTTSQPLRDMAESPTRIRHKGALVTDQKRSKPLWDKGCDVVTDENPEAGGVEVLDL